MSNLFLGIVKVTKTVRIPIAAENIEQAEAFMRSPERKWIGDGGLDVKGTLEVVRVTHVTDPNECRGFDSDVLCWWAGAPKDDDEFTLSDAYFRERLVACFHPELTEISQEQADQFWRDYEQEKERSSREFHSAIEHFCEGAGVPRG
jgi:hypothetical protein